MRYVVSMCVAYLLELYTLEVCLRKATAMSIPREGLSQLIPRTHQTLQAHQTNTTHHEQNVFF